MTAYELIFAFLFAIWLFALLAYLGHGEKRPGPMYGRPGEINAEYGQDYRGLSRKGQSLFAPGGAMFLVIMVAMMILAYLLRNYIASIADWLTRTGGAPY